MCTRSETTDQLNSMGVQEAARLTQSATKLAASAAIVPQQTTTNQRETLSGGKMRMYSITSEILIPCIVETYKNALMK